MLVDTFSSGSLLARAAADRCDLLHVRSRSRMPSEFALSLPADVFRADLKFPGREDDVLRELAAHDPVAVICGSEFGVAVADMLAARLALRGNDPALSTARRDKSRMGEVLAAAGVPVAAQLRATDPVQVLRWRAAEGLTDVVLKPLDSAGSEDVFFCTDEAEIATAFERILGKDNLMMRVNRAVLAQERLEGTELVVNSVSRDGRHWFTDVWCSHKDWQDGRLIYDYEDLLAPDDPELNVVLPYVSDVLAALGVAHGPAHTELILTPRGPRLLETAARPSGLANPAALTRCTGADQIGLTLDCFLGDGAELAVRPKCYRRLRHARVVNLVARREVLFDPQVVTQALSMLPAFDSVRFRLPAGRSTRPTVDLNSSPGVVFLVSEDPQAVKKAYDVLREFEFTFY